MNRKREKKIQSDQPAWKPCLEELQLHHNHEKFLFLTVLLLLLFAQCKMNHWWLVTWLDLTWLDLTWSAIWFFCDACVNLRLTHTA
jgi:hypothetical protein